MKSTLSTLAIVCLFIAGFGFLLYPVASEYLNHRLQEEIISEYDDNITDSTVERIEEEKAAAKRYNEYLQSGKVVVTDPFEAEKLLSFKNDYEKLLNIGGNGVMGYLEIPKISVYMAIYHTTSDEVMQKGVGHLPETSLPIGGPGTHAVLSSHRGLKKAKLFSELDKLEKGDLFYIHILNDVLAYKVDQIKTVLPNDISDLKIDNDKDYVTLLTCTPYGVNTHRLLVRGTRTEYIPPAETNEEKTLPYGWQSIVIAIAAILGIMIVSFARRIK